MVIDFEFLKLFDFNLFDLKLSDYFYSKPFIISILLFIIIICIIGCIVAAFIFCMICSYFIYKYLHININDNYVYFYDYNDKIKALLEKYGDHAINKLYLIRGPVSTILYYFINVITFYRYKKYLYHTSLICEINMPNNIKKYILLEKNNCININEKQYIKSINLCKKKNKQRDTVESEVAEVASSNNIKNKKIITLNNILKQTRERIGDEKFFNWHIYKNNCQLFTKEILITINKFNKQNKEYIFQNNILKTELFPEIIIHILNCLLNSYNIIQKYIF